jgi:hypothetical protein
VGSLAVKTPRRANFDEGLACNLQEIARWQLCPKYCPILWWGCDGRAVIMRRATSATLPEVKSIMDSALGEDFEAEYTFCPMIPKNHTVQGELNERNIGIVDGRFVILDYGDP